MDLSGSGDGAKVLKLVSDENQPPKYENEFKDSDSDCQKYSDSDSDEEDVYSAIPLAFVLCVILCS